MCQILSFAAFASLGIEHDILEGPTILIFFINRYILQFFAFFSFLYSLLRLFILLIWCI